MLQLLYTTKKLILLYCVISCCLLLNAQQPSTTEPTLSQKIAYLHHQQDTLAIIYAEDISDYYFSKKQIDSAAYYAHKEQTMARTNNNKNYEFRSLGRLAIIYTNLSVSGYRDSLKYYANKAIEFAEEQDLQDTDLVLSYLYYYLGQNAYYYENKTEEAYRLYLRAAELAEQAQDAHWYLRICYNLSVIYSNEGLDKSVLELATTSLEKSKNFTGRKAKKYVRLWLEILKAKAMGPDFENEQEKQWALNVFHRLIAENKRLEDELDIMYTITDYLPTYENILSRDSILIYSKRAFQILKKYDKNPNTVNVLLEHGKILFKYQKYKAALPVFENAFQFYKDNGGEYFLKNELLGNLVATHLKLGNTTKAFDLFSDYKEARDSSAVLEKENSIEKVEATYALEKSELERKNLLEKNQFIQTRSNLYAAIGGLLLLFLLIGAYFFWQLRKTKQKLEEINASKNQLFAILAHDIKGPAHAFDKLSKKLNYLIRKNDYKRLVLLAESFEEKGQQLNLIINNILNWAIAQKDGMDIKPERLPIKEKVDEIIAEIEELFDNKNLIIENNISKDTKYTFDPNAFKVVVRNLLENAVKFSYPNSKIHIEEDTNNNLLKIRDEGVGMEKEVIQKILAGMPTSSQPGTKAEKGTGVGLSTCVILARKNNANIYINSELEKGTTVMLKMMN